VRRLGIIVTAILLLAVSTASASPWANRQATPAVGTPSAATSGSPPVLIGATPVSSGATPIASGGTALGTGIAGDALDLVPAGQPGQVAIVAIGPLPAASYDGQLIIVRNTSGGRWRGFR